MPAIRAGSDHSFTNESSAIATVGGRVLQMRQFERPIPAPVLVPAESAG